SHLPIVPPEYYEDHPVDVILIVAPGYTREIAETIRSRYGSRVKILMLRSDHLEEWKETV
ncbi:MAG: methyltransferase, partial [Hungatella sp.]